MRPATAGELRQTPARSEPCPLDDDAGGGWEARGRPGTRPMAEDGRERDEFPEARQRRRSRGATTAGMGRRRRAGRGRGARTAAEAWERTGARTAADGPRARGSSGID